MRLLEALYMSTTRATPMNILDVEIPKNKGGDYKNIITCTIEEFVALHPKERNAADLIQVIFTHENDRMVVAKDKFGDREMSYSAIETLWEELTNPHQGIESKSTSPKKIIVRKR